MDSIAIVGASLAGIRAAQTLREDGFKGSITLIGEEPERPYDRPPLSKEALASMAADISAENLSLVKPENYETLDLDEKLGVRAEALNLSKLSVDLSESQGTVQADAILIATGARPITLPGTENLAGVHTLRTIQDCQALSAELHNAPRRVAIIGAGFIGSEVAATARGLGLEVSVIEMAEVPLEQALGSEMGQICADIHRENGVDLQLGVKVESLLGEKNVEALALSDGSTLEADVVLVGIGVQPNTEWLENSGLELDNGVVCDETCLAAPNVAAAGDVARWPNHRFGGELMRVEHWDNAIEQGKAAARRLLVSEEEGRPYTPIPWFWSDQYGHKIQLAGISSAIDDVKVIWGSVKERKFAALYGRAGRLVGVLGFNTPRQVMKYRQLIESETSYEQALDFEEQQS